MDESGVLEELHAKPVKVDSNHYNGKSQRNQEAVVPIIRYSLD